MLSEIKDKTYSFQNTRQLSKQNINFFWKLPITKLWCDFNFHGVDNVIKWLWLIILTVY